MPFISRLDPPFHEHSYRCVHNAVYGGEIRSINANAADGGDVRIGN